MCGIAGLAGHLQKEQLTAAIHAMNGAMTHRGPDDQGVWVGDNFAFGMRRLSIIDLAGGHQPMWDSRTGTGIVYNGEVYNYKPLRAGLEKAGFSFQTTSDSEVVLKSLVLNGSKAVHDWNGMFAVAAWNDQKKKLLLIRDRVGVKPLYYYWDGSLLMFASEIKALLASNLMPRRLNQQAIWDYLTYHFVPGPETMWNNVWKLPPGHMLEWAPDGVPRITQYWQTDVISPDEPGDIDKKTKEFQDLFLDSVEQRLLAADVPVGVMLSGGLDSSAVAAAAVELGHKRFHTFCVGFSEGGEYSEVGYAEQVAKHLGVEHHSVVVDRPGFMNMLPEAVRATDEPLADLTIVPLLAVCKLAREHVKVVLSGEGADEILAGYHFDQFRNRTDAIRRMQRIPSPLLNIVSKALTLFSEKHADELSRVGKIPLSMWNVEHKNHMTRTWSQTEKTLLWSAFEGQDSDRILRDMYALSKSLDPLDQTLSVHQKAWLVEDLLMRADKISMAASLELRVPFLDYRLVEWANRQPLGVKLGRAKSRYITKHALRQFAETRLPKAIIDRPKRGFWVPVCDWLKEKSFNTWTREHLMGKQARLRNLFEAEEMERHLRHAASGNLQAAYKIWLLIVLETWLTEYDVDADAFPLPLDATLVGG
jgi:asparagine synthase (glutamine-hydrolysing)